MSFFSKTKGAVSIFLVIILLPMMALSSFFVDASRIKLAKTVAESAGDLALNTALTDYDTQLKDFYGIFATAQDTDELYDKLERYFRASISSTGVPEEDAEDITEMLMAQLQLTEKTGNVSDLLEMELIDFAVSKRTDATLCNAAALKKQIVDFMKYRAPINTGLSFLTAIKSFSNLKEQTDLVDSRTNYYKEQGSVMEACQNAWKYIYIYNKAGFAKSKDYFEKMEQDFAGYEAKYQDFAKKIIMDLYDAKDYVDFHYRAYVIEGVEEEVEGKKKTVPVFYLDSKKENTLPAYNKLTTFSNTHKSKASDVISALNNYYAAFQAVGTAYDNFLSYDADKTYAQQYLVQTMRNNLYYTWTDSFKILYEKYSFLRHAVTYHDDGVMESKAKLFGDKEEHTLGEYYNRCMGGDDTHPAEFDAYTRMQLFNKYKDDLSSRLQKMSNSAKETTPVAITALDNEIHDVFVEVTAYRSAVYNARNSLRQAVEILSQGVYERVKYGGTLDNKKEAWKTNASKGEIKNTSMSKQDLAEIESLSTYLKEEDVRKLIDRLRKISGHLDDLLNQIDSYKFFDLPLTQIQGFDTLCEKMELELTARALQTVPTTTKELNEKADIWCNNRFTIGEKIETQWSTQPESQTILAGNGANKLNFYSYLYTHFNQSTVDAGDKAEVKADEENGEKLYDNIKKSSSSEAEKSAGVKDENASGNDGKEGDKSKQKEIYNKKNRPSTKRVDAQNEDMDKEDGKIDTSEDAVSTSGSKISKMFTSLINAAKTMGTGLRDNLYVSDYILSMFSYDTIAEEFKSKKPTAKNVDLKTLTLNPIDEKHNYLYGKEVEYILFGGKAATNVTKTYALIYAIRLAFNLIYAFMDSSIRDTALAIATPISAATLGIIPVPLIQAVIIIGISCIESGLDLAELKKGEKVPLFKDGDTFKCSVKGLMNVAKEEVGSLMKDAANKAIDMGAEKLNEYLDMADEQLTEAVKGKTNDITNSISSSYDALITRHVDTVIQKFTTLCNNAIEEYCLDPSTNMADYVKTRLDQWLKEEEGRSNKNDIAFTVKKEAVDLIKSQFVDRMLQELQKASSAVESNIAAISNQIQTVVESIKTEITDTIVKTSQKVLDYKDKMKKQIEDSLNEGADKFKETLSTQIDGIFGSGDGSQNGDTTGVAALLSFSYKDYLRLFLMVGLYTDQEGIILRTGDVLQYNMRLVTGNNKYTLDNSAVYVDIKATIQVKPLLLAMPLFADLANNPADNREWYTFTYQTVQGY